MQLPECGCQFSCERKSGNQLHKESSIPCTKSTMYGEWLALHQVLAGKLCYTFIYMHAWNHY